MAVVTGGGHALGQKPSSLSSTPEAPAVSVTAAKKARRRDRIRPLLLQASGLLLDAAATNFGRPLASWQVITGRMLSR